MFAYATGWLGWSRSEALDAPFPDIQLALDGKVDFLAATTPGARRRTRRKPKDVAELKERARAVFGLKRAEQGMGAG
ncbi:hypothetical protein VY88_03025 [Azospirillum thiophilum]|uniref:Uncharacterized protein n=1 Tax=Azospirillum thiophilum TaxID=528244 RepID=A0AAC8ZTT1_9PROT|nr:hypothetical protein [Azospirillum thiophilum]ALG71138.1 hypothetical protein AL072_09685 [Azospirillum thiophilum]KJR65206.1 hypothetical protein VY88_03025 [Azospirillum thiophilum]